MAALLDL
jgi:hypothetical protein